MYLRTVKREKYTSLQCSRRGAGLRKEEGTGKGPGGRGGRGGGFSRLLCANALSVRAMSFFFFECNRVRFFMNLQGDAIHTHMHSHTLTHTHTHVCVCVCVCTYICTCIHMFMHLQVCLYVYICTYIHTYIHTYLFIFVYIC